MDRDTHKRLLEYRERHAYFGGSTPLLTLDEFLSADAEERDLAARGDTQDDEEEARWNELARLLFRD